MAFGGGGSSDNAFLIGPFLEWWDKFTARRGAKRTAKLEAKRTAKAETKPTAKLEAEGTAKAEAKPNDAGTQ